MRAAIRAQGPRPFHFRISESSGMHDIPEAVSVQRQQKGRHTCPSHGNNAISHKPTWSHLASFVSFSLTDFDAQHSRVRRIRKFGDLLASGRIFCKEILDSPKHNSTACARSLRPSLVCSGVVGVEVAVVAAGKCAISSWKEDVDLAVC